MIGHPLPTSGQAIEMGAIGAALGYRPLFGAPALRSEISLVAFAWKAGESFVRLGGVGSSGITGAE